MNAGIVVRTRAALDQARGRGVETLLGTDWSMPWSRTLFVGPTTLVPWDLLGFAFAKILERWDVAAPFPRVYTLAESLGTAADRERTRALWGDLRVPTYSPELLLVRGSEAGQAFLKTWRGYSDPLWVCEKCGSSSSSAEHEGCPYLALPCDECDERLAFLRALAAVKPLFCPLPRLWLAEERVRQECDGRTRPRRPTSPPAPFRPVPRPTIRRIPPVLEKRRMLVRKRIG